MVVGWLLGNSQDCWVWLLGLVAWLSPGGVENAQL